MNISKEQNGSSLTIALEGRLDTMTSPELEAEIKGLPADVKDLTLDLGALEYISSAGLRVLLAAHKLMSGRDGAMKVTKPNEIVREVLDVTGFCDILNIG